MLVVVVVSVSVSVKYTVSLVFEGLGPNPLAKMIYRQNKVNVFLGQKYFDPI